jgi:hypothetical protein
LPYGGGSSGSFLCSSATVWKTAHSVELGFWMFSQYWQLHGGTNSLCEIHRQFCQFAAQLQNEFPVQTPISERAERPLQLPACRFEFSQSDSTSE